MLEREVAARTKASFDEASREFKREVLVKIVFV
jgi:hypothetical protein